MPAKHRHTAAVFHLGDALLVKDVYKTRHNGSDNPNVALLKELTQARVDLRVCGCQRLLGKKLEPSQAPLGVQADLWAMTTMINLQLRGYVRIGG